MNHTRRTSRILPLSIAAAAVSLGVLTGCGNSTASDQPVLPSGTASPSPSATSSTTPTSSPTPKGELPADSNVAVQATASQDPESEGSVGGGAGETKTYTSAQGEASFDYPADWSVVPKEKAQGVDVKNAQGAVVATLRVVDEPATVSPVSIVEPVILGKASGAIDAAGNTGQIAIGYFPGQAPGSGAVIYGVDPLPGQHPDFGYFETPKGKYVSFMGVQERKGMDQQQLAKAAAEYSRSSEFAQVMTTMRSLRTAATIGG